MRTLYPTHTKAKVIQVIRVETTEGQGIESDPVRSIIRYFDFEGRLLATYDHWAETKETGEHEIA